jgi:hypothetical protein
LRHLTEGLASRQSKLSTAGQVLASESEYTRPRKIEPRSLFRVIADTDRILRGCHRAGPTTGLKRYHGGDKWMNGTEVT